MGGAGSCSEIRSIAEAEPCVCPPGSYGRAVAETAPEPHGTALLYGRRSRRPRGLVGRDKSRPYDTIAEEPGGPESCVSAGADTSVLHLRRLWCTEVRAGCAVCPRSEEQRCGWPVGAVVSDPCNERVRSTDVCRGWPAICRWAERDACCDATHCMSWEVVCRTRKCWTWQTKRPWPR